MHSNQSKSIAHINPIISKVINWGAIIIALCLIVVIYYFVFYSNSMRFEHFKNSTSDSILTNTTTSTVGQVGQVGQVGRQVEQSIPFKISSSNDSVYEKALNLLFGENARMICNMNPSLDNTVCKISGVTFSYLHFPVQMIKMQDGTILGVFNDGRMYSKDTQDGTIWVGPLDNSLPNSQVPLRMITLTPDLSYLLGVAYDNQLYIRTLDSQTGKFDVTALWKPVTNNYDVIYVIFDRDTKFMVSIDTKGKLFIKTSIDITSQNTEITNSKLDRAILRLYYDNFGYMLAIDNQFKLYQFTEKDWKKSGLNLERGANAAQINDIIYANDGKLIAFVFQPNIFMLTTMKQSQSYYLSQFIPLDMLHSLSISSLDSKPSANYLMSDGDVIAAKIGYINPALTANDNDVLDQDVVFAFNQQSLKDQGKLRDFCTSRYNTTVANADNYDVLSQVEENSERISLLKDVLDNLIKYDPDKTKIQETYPALYPYKV